MNFITPITKELDFEAKLVDLLIKHGWEPAILNSPSEEDLIQNWAAIIFNNNRDRNQLGNAPLTPTEMDQILRQVNDHKTPYHRNQLINGGYVSIVRDNKEDHINCGKTVYLYLFNPRAVNAGPSVYQIVRQPRFKTSHPLAGNRRGDVMLLINGMPVIHIELKRSGVDVSQAVNQIRKYTHEGVFLQGIFSLIQIFVAMTPEKTLYFANPGTKENFQSAFQFHWADFNNNEAFDWQYVTANLLSIPMAHQLVGSYTIADDKDESLKVLRSYQYYAANAICDRVHKTNWDDHAHKGGFIWHTTGSGKTMTSFKAAQLIANAKEADKVVFLLDRIELSTQSADEYRGFANASDDVLDTENTAQLISLLEDNDKEKCLIVTSIQKMANINPRHGVPQSIIDAIGRKRVVFIVDECHRSVGGAMLMDIKRTFPRALLFGFTGTPVFEENAHGEITTGVIFGDMLHKYTLANGIPDRNVLGFDLIRADVYPEQDLRNKVALKMCEVEDYDQVEGNPQLEALYNGVMNDMELIKVETEAARMKLYENESYHRSVMYRIMENFDELSRQWKFHAILATKNIPEAIEYYKLFKEHFPEFNVAAIFDDNIDNDGKSEYKEDAILEMLDDYNRKFGTSFQQSSYARYKKDVAKRLAHKTPYARLEKKKQLNLLIVVTQMLTGYDSKWVNTLYVDKLLQYVDVVQAFSRTNRLFGPEKPHGIIKFFCRPEQMERNIEDALSLYVDQPQLVFVDKLESNLENINKCFAVIENLFHAEGIRDFASLPQSEISRKKFAKEFCAMTRLLESSKMQGFSWDEEKYEFKHTNGYVYLSLTFDEHVYTTLRQRYKELFEREKQSSSGSDDVYELESYITESGAGTIDADYINSNFIRFVKYLYTEGADSNHVKNMLQKLHFYFASLSQRDQRTALTIIHDIQNGELRLQPEKNIYDYIKDYQKEETDHQVRTFCEISGLDPFRLADIINDDVNEGNIDQFGRFAELMKTGNRSLYRDLLKRIFGREVKPLVTTSIFQSLTRRFILNPSDRAKILYAYFTDGAILDENITDKTIEEDEDRRAEEKAEAIRTELSSESNILSEEEMHENILNAVAGNLRRLSVVHNWPGTQEAVSKFFQILSTPTLPYIDGIEMHIRKACNEIYGRRKTTIGDKHSGLTQLLINFEIFLRKIYYLQNGCDMPEMADLTRKVTLHDILRNTRSLSALRLQSDPKSRILNEIVNDIRNWRNTRDGNGAHGSMILSDQELDRRLSSVLTIYIYAAGTHRKTPF